VIFTNHVNDELGMPVAMPVHRHDTPAANSHFCKNRSCYLQPGGIMKERLKIIAGKGGGLAVLALLLVAVAVPAAAQKNKEKKKQQPQSESTPDTKNLPSMSDTQAVDLAIGQSLGYWQIGDVDSLHKYYADDVVVVTGDWSPPLIGWDNYAKAYQSQRARVTGGRMDRTNTFIKIDGNTAWATYQFYYVTSLNNQTSESRGHTTLILNKRGDRWVIVLNHSSIVEPTPASPVPAADSPQSGRP
jgi:ketosteroid isomerase-like protein